MPDQSPPLVLVAEDDDARRYTIAQTLGRAGLRVIEAATGADALGLAATGPALIILDLHLPDIDGFEVCRRLKADPGTASVLVLHLAGTFAGADERAQGLDGGADACLTDTTEPTVLVATVRALLRLRRAEEAAQAASRAWQATFDAITDGVFLLDRAGRVIRCNGALAALVGRPAGELLGRPAEALLHRLPAAAVPFTECLASRARASIDLPVESRWFRLTADPVLTADGDLAGAVGILSDITDRKRAEEVAQAADRRKDEFLAMLGHELRNPLAPIRNALFLMKLRGSKDTGDAERLRAMMDRQITHLARLVDDLLDVSRLNQGALELRTEPVDLRESIANVVDAVQTFVSERQHTLEVSVPADPVILQADPVRLEQVLVNLLHNACKYTEPGGRITLAASVRDTHVEIHVCDTGIGIRPEMTERIFDRFMHGDRLSGRLTEGLGLGLALVKTLVEMHGGTVGVTSEGPGKGSEFTVRLPLPAPVATNRPAPPPAEAGRPLKVLVVDDNVDAADSLRMVLEAQGGHTVRVAYDGLTGVAVAASFHPDVVLLDIGLPKGVDGYEVARRLRAVPELGQVPVVALTGYGRTEDRRKSGAAGFTAHLVKPVDPKSLRELLAQVRPG